jgi:Restriction endonuclease XhoI
MPHHNQTRAAIQAFWGGRDAALIKQASTSKQDAGTRGAVTAGKNLDGFVQLITELVRSQGLKHAKVHVARSLVVLPGFFRPTKQWDVLVMNGPRLVAALEFKSQVGSFGNNFNNRTEEAIGTAHCLWTAYREGALGEQPRPFLGWLMLVEDAPGSNEPVEIKSPHFKAAPEFSGTSYLQRYDLLCRKLVKEQLYTAACLLATPSSGAQTGAYRELSELSGLANFVNTLAGHLAAEALRDSSPSV